MNSQGLEDHLGDMDFKIAGTRKGITAIQLDIKPAGIPLDIICECLEPARKGRTHILNRMEQEINSARTTHHGNPPPVTLKYSNDSLRRLLGPLGLHRKRIEQETGARIAVSDGTVTIVAKNQMIMEKAREKLDFLVGREIEVGRIYKGVVTSVKEYGAFVEFNGGQQGLLHISELSHEQVSKVSDAVSVGQELSLMCIGQDVRGNIKLSLKAALPQRGSKTNDVETHDPFAPTKQMNVWASVENVSVCVENEESSNSNVSEGNETHSATDFTPSIVIRSASECDAQDISATQHIKKKTRQTTKSTPRPYDRSSNDKSGRRSAVSSTRVRVKKENDSFQTILLVKDDANNEKKPISSGLSKVDASSLKLGDTVTAKVCQIRSHGLVLELGGGIRGMYKFEANGRRDFEVGNELHVRCSAFSSKGIPVFSLLRDD